MQNLKSTRWSSIFRGKCPICFEGDMYEEANAYKLKSVLKMHENCSSCGVKYKMEPSFFFGAMYVSYAVGVAIAVAVFIISFFILGWNEHYTFIAIIAVLILTFPFILRVSRNIWINLFLKGDKLEKKEV